MNKFGKMRVIAAFTLALTMLASVAAPSFASAEGESVMKSFEPRAVEIDGENEALSGWQYYFYNESLKHYYQSDELFVRATKNGRTGNALHLKRDKADGELVMYSYAFDVKPDQNYVIGAFVKSLCAQTADNKVYFKIKEQSANGGVVGDEFAVQHSVDGRREDWTETTFSYKTSASAKTLILKICADGVGDFYVDDITVKSSNTATNTALYRMQGIGKVADGAGDAVGNGGGDHFEVLTSANISNESSDGDNASLLLNDGEIFKTNFSILEESKTYRLSFKYKMLEAGSENRLSIRMNYREVGETDQKFYLDLSGGNADEWSTYTYDFMGKGLETFAIAIRSFAKYAIDELSITCQEETDNMQYIVNGSFSGAYMEGYVFGDNFNVAKQADGTPVFVAGNGSFDDTFGARGYFTIPAANLTEGKEYTLSYDYRFNGATWVNSVIIYHNDATVESYTGTSTEWTTKTYNFVAGAKNEFKFYGPSYYYWATYYRNIQIKDSDGNRYDINSGLVAPEVVLGENEFPYGTFEGNVNYVAKDWNIVNGGIYGLTFEDGNKDYKVCLNGSAGNPATAVTKDIDVAGARLISVDKKIEYTADSAFGSNLAVTVLAGENEIAADENGLFSLPEGTTTVKIKFSTEEYVTFKKVFVKFTGIGTVAGASIRANTPYGIHWTVRVKTAEWNKLVETYGEANVKAGVIIAPLDYLGSGETAVPFTIDAFKAANKKYVDIVTDTFNVNLKNEVEGYSGFYASLVNIKAGNLNREFIARSYVAVTEDGVTAYYYGEYSAEDNARTIYEVGKGAIASDTESENVKTFVKNEVLDKIADVTVKDGVAAMTAINGYTSPYSVSINGKVLTITVMDGADVNLSEVLKIVCVNGKNYKPAVSGNLATVTIN